MEILFIILGVIFFVLILLLILPITVDLGYKEELLLKIKFSGITFFDSEKRVEVKNAKKPKKVKRKSAADETENKKTSEDNFLKKTYKQKGLTRTVSYFGNILVMLLKKLWWVVRRLKFRHFNLDLSIATSDAAETAITYGKVCAAIYPVISFLETNADFKAKSISVKADFDKAKPEFQISLSVTTRLFFWLIAALTALIDFLKLQRKESEKYE